MLLTDLSPTVHNSPPRCGLCLTLSLGHVLPHCGTSRKLPNLFPTPLLFQLFHGLSTSIPRYDLGPKCLPCTSYTLEKNANHKQSSNGCLLHHVKQVHSQVSERLGATVFGMIECGSVGRWNSHPEHESSTFLRNVVRILPYTVK